MNVGKFLKKHFKGATHRLSSQSGFEANRSSPSREKKRLRNYNKELVTEGKSVREISRWLVTNDPTSSGIVATILQNVIFTGIYPKPVLDYEALGISEEEATRIQDIMYKEFELWSKDCDLSGRLDFLQIQKLLMREFLVSGDIFIYPQIDEDGVMRLQIIDPLRVRNVGGDGAVGDRIDGVQISPQGKFVSYTISNDRYFTGVEDFTEIEASKIIPFGNYVYPDQVRGTPLLLPVVNNLVDLGDFLEAELISKKLSACYVAFITKNQSDLDADDDVSFGASGFDGSNSFNEDFYPGMVERLNSGEGVEIAQGKNSDPSLQNYTNIMFRRIASAIGLPAEFISRDITALSYSSLRHASLEAQRFFRDYQKRFVYCVLDKIYPLFVENLVMRRRIQGLTISRFRRNKNLWCGVDWQIPGWQWVDPLREIQAASLSVENGFSTRQEEVSKRGKNFKAIQQQLLEEERIIRDRRLRLREEFPELEEEVNNNEEVMEDEQI